MKETLEAIFAKSRLKCKGQISMNGSLKKEEQSFNLFLIPKRLSEQEEKRRSGGGTARVPRWRPSGPLGLLVHAPGSGHAAASPHPHHPHREELVPLLSKTLGDGEEVYIVPRVQPPLALRRLQHEL
uniref:Uncharacterized protein n=1 Tax=Ixodes ricinus TaxID=34613 RepID=A0A0K8RI36_IXORI